MNAPVPVRAQARGQPLFALLAVLVGWIGGRAAIWEAPVLSGRAEVLAERRQPARMPDDDGPMRIAGPQSLPESDDYAVLGVSRQDVLPEAGYGDAEGGTQAGRYAEYPPLAMPVVPAGRPVAAGGRRLSGWYMEPPGWRASTWSESAVRSGSSWVKARPPVWSSKAAYGPDPFAIPGFAGESASAVPPAAAPGSVPPVPRGADGARHWSADTWALFRHDLGTAKSRGILPAVYGGSQTGAVLRYRLSPASRHRLAVYLRSTAALGMARETSAAMGLSARPLPDVPVVVAVEGRMTDEGRTSIQPVVLAYTELPPAALPLRFRAEPYLQAGYVGGRYATPFADGQLRVEREMLRIGRSALYLGGGLWGGAQQGASRLDAGPALSVTMPAGRKVFGRLALDWRFRVAGNATPGSGPAVTLSAGF